jgi:hypothetical protein
MSWVYLPGPEADCLPAPTSSDGEPSAPLKSTSTASACSRSASEMACLTPSPSGTTSLPSMAALGEDRSTLSAGASPVRTSRPLDEVPVWQEIARVCGSKCSESLASASLRMSSPKTPRCFALEGWMSSSAGLPTWGLMLAGVCLELGTSVRPTAETECGSLLPTPTVAGNENSPSMQKWAAHRNLSAMMATPTASGSDARNTNRPSALATRAMMLPTPIASDRNGDRQREGRTGGVFIALREWMMGWPLGWSASEPLATDRFLQWLHSHGRR